jgi:capsular exopolysaccharide synthesis family protein
MSRIHEALKKAEEERAANQRDRRLEEPAEQLGSHRAVKIAAESEIVLPPPGLPDSGTGANSALLQFDELRAKCVKSVWNPDPKVQLFYHSNPFAPGAEQFRTLRSRLYRIRESQPLNTLLITSAMQAEGKTLVSANLAQALVRQRGCKVLLIDADLRAPLLRELLGVPTGPGLADYLRGGASESDVIQRGQEDELYFIQAGENITHPAELISNGRLKQLLARVAGLFDWIILDSPPILPVSDAAVLAPMCDGVLMVVRAGTTPAEASQRACQELGDAHVVGVVLNSVEKSATSGSYYEYGYGLHASADSRK